MRLDADTKLSPDLGLCFACVRCATLLSHLMATARSLPFFGFCMSIGLIEALKL